MNSGALRARTVCIAALCFCLGARADEPGLRLVSPEDGAVFKQGEPILLQAEPRGTQAGAIEKVEFVSRSVIGEATNAPFASSWTAVPPGIHSISVRARTAAGLVESWKSTIAVLPQPNEVGAVHVDGNYGGAGSDGSVKAPYRRIQEAVDNAVSGATIKVAAGDYREAVVIRDKDVRLIGGYTGASAAVYSQGGSGDFASRTVRSTRVLGEGADQVIEVDFNGTTRWSIVDGLTISGGKRGVQAHTFEDPTGKYFLLMNSAITGNASATDSAGGVSINQVSTGVLSNSIAGNTALGYAGLFVNGTALTVGLIKGNSVENNISTEDYSHAAGIAFRGAGTTGSIVRNVVRGNRAFYGAGIFVDGDVASNFTRLSFNTVTHNKGIFGTGEFVDGGATAIIEHDLIAWNETLNREFGGAFGVDSGPATHASLINCTVAFNASYNDEFSGGNGLGITEDNSDQVTVEVKNCIFWRNSMVPGGKEINAPANGVLQIAYSDVDQLLEANAHIQLGTGVFRADPLFADPQLEDFHLRSKAGRWNPGGANGQGAWVSDDADSPCLDIGDPASVFSLEPTPNGGRINLGAWGNTIEASKSGESPGFAFTNLRLLSSGVREISASGPPGRFQLQAASAVGSLQTTWIDLDVLTNTAGAVVYRDNSPSSSPHRFYRARLLP